MKDKKEVYIGDIWHEAFSNGYASATEKLQRQFSEEITMLVERFVKELKGIKDECSKITRYTYDGKKAESKVYLIEFCVDSLINEFNRKLKSPSERDQPTEDKSGEGENGVS